MGDDPYINVNIYNWESFETSESPMTSFTNSGISDSSSVGLGLAALTSSSETTRENASDQQVVHKSCF